MLFNIGPDFLNLFPFVFHDNHHRLVMVNPQTYFSCHSSLLDLIFFNISKSDLSVYPRFGIIGQHLFFCFLTTRERIRDRSRFPRCDRPLAKKMVFSLISAVGERSDPILKFPTQLFGFSELIGDLPKGISFTTLTYDRLRSRSFTICYPHNNLAVRIYFHTFWTNDMVCHPLSFINDLRSSLVFDG